MDTQNWLNEADSHSGFQLDLSCMLDGELDEGYEVVVETFTEAVTGDADEGREVEIVPAANVLSRLRHAPIQTRRLRADVADRDETSRPPVVTTEPGHGGAAPGRAGTMSTRGTSASHPVMPERTALPMDSMPRCRTAAIAKATMMRQVGT